MSKINFKCGVFWNNKWQGNCWINQKFWKKLTYLKRWRKIWWYNQVSSSKYFFIKLLLFKNYFFFIKRITVGLINISRKNLSILIEWKLDFFGTYITGHITIKIIRHQKSFKDINLIFFSQIWLIKIPHHHMNCNHLKIQNIV